MTTSTRPRRYLWIVAWGHPYTNPPDGGPRERFRIETSDVRCPREADEALHILGGPGCGFSIHFSALDARPPRRWSVPLPEMIRPL